MKSILMNRYQEKGNLIYTVNLEVLQQIIHHYDLEVGMNVESGEIEVIYFSTPSHNLVLIWDNKPKSNVSILFAQDVNEDEVILFNQSTEYLEAFGITTDNYSREFERLPAYNY